MRILLVADVVGGVRTFVAELAARLVRADVELHLALFGSNTPPELGQLPLASAQTRRLKLEWMDDPWSDVERAGAWISERAAAIGPDLVHMNTFTPIECPGTPILQTVHSCVLTWWQAVHGRAAPATWDRYRACAMAALARAEQLITPTRALLAALERCYGPLPGAAVIPCGRRVPLGDDALSPTPREPLVVSVGRLWDEAKNAELVVRCAPRLAGRFVLIGPGDPGRSVEAIGAQSPEVVLAWLRRSAVFAEPARYEPFGLAALEAALCGAALVLGDIPSLREVWGPAARYVGPDDEEGFVHAVAALLGDPLVRDRAAAVAHRRAVRYTPEAMASAYLARYAELVAPKVLA